MGYGEGAAAAYNYADWAKRALGALIDYIIPSLLAGLIGRGNTALGNLLSLVAFAWALYNCYLGGQTGQSYGKRIARHRLISEQTGQPPGGGLGIGRYFVHILDSLACFIGWFWPLWDSKRQTFADKILKTVVVTADALADGMTRPPSRATGHHPGVCGSGPRGVPGRTSPARPAAARLRPTAARLRPTAARLRPTAARLRRTSARLRPTPATASPPRHMVADTPTGSGISPRSAAVAHLGAIFLAPLVVRWFGTSSSRVDSGGLTPDHPDDRLRSFILIFVSRHPDDHRLLWVGWC